MKHVNAVLHNERGIALVLVMVITVVVGTITVAAAMISTNVSLVERYSDRQSTLNAVADAGIAEARSRINGDKTLYPDSSYNTLENGVAVTDADGTVIPGVRRWTYVGPSGVTSGQYGVFGSIVTVVEDQAGNQIIRRGEVAQESFAKYAYFTDIEPSNISFGSGDQIQGPVHSNSDIKIYSSGATFHSTVTTAMTVPTPQYGTFVKGYTENAPRIAMPQTADLTKLQVQAAAGGTSFTAPAANEGRALLRIEFVAIDLDGDGSSTGPNEGFIRVYQGNSGEERFVIADIPSDYYSGSPDRGLENSVNCGHFEGDGSFNVANNHPTSGSDDFGDALISNTRRCFPGGSDSLNATAASPWARFVANDGRGQWLQWPGTVSPLLAGRPDAQYLFPITRSLNPNFKGVIYVDGKVAISGVLRGRVTLAATDDILIIDDLVYATNPGAGTCDDILGLFSGDDIRIADNTINAPIVADPGASGNKGNPMTRDDTASEFIHGVVLALNIFTVHNYNSGAQSEEPCEGISRGRGCIYLTGGIIQNTRGAVGTGSGYGYVKRYSYDVCAFTNPPPYFPTTGHFARGRMYEVDPTGFSLSQYWTMLTPPII